MAKLSKISTSRKRCSRPFSPVEMTAKVWLAGFKQFRSPTVIFSAFLKLRKGALIDSGLSPNC
jgi:hypothetical protein